MSLTRSEVSNFIISPLSSFHILLLVSVVSYFIRLMVVPPIHLIPHLLCTLVLTSVWVGSLLAISFLESWTKFLAPNLTLAVAMDVGRHVFSMFNKLEIIFSVVLLHLLEMQWTNSTLQLPYDQKQLENLNLSLLLPIVLVTFLQTCWLLPALLHKSQLIIASHQINRGDGATSNNSVGDDRVANSARTRFTFTTNLRHTNRSLSHTFYVLTDIVKVVSLSYAIYTLVYTLLAYIKVITRL